MMMMMMAASVQLQEVFVRNMSEAKFLQIVVLLIATVFYR
jgi:hypothetical protein